MVDVGRARRLSKRIATVVASAIEFEIKDPPLAFVTITDTKVTGDLHDATVYYTVRGETLQDEPDYAAAAAALERAKGTLRSRVGAATGVRFSNYHTAASCAATRGMLLTGVDSHRNGVPNLQGPDAHFCFKHFSRLPCVPARTGSSGRAFCRGV
mgnify:CR=1 FL=1